MDVEIQSREKVGFSPILKKLMTNLVGLAREVKKIGEDDPRRLVHSLKVGLALTLVSVFYYVRPLFNGFGTSSIMWAVLTIVTVMEYTVGGTLSKGLNRAFATLVAGALGIGTHEVAMISGEGGEPIVLGVFVFLLATAATFSRFIPEIKARYDYGVVIFILTFSLVAVSSYRVDEIIELASRRLSTMAIGVAICLIISIFIFPVWAGEELHNKISGDLEKLATFLEGVGTTYFSENVDGENIENFSLDLHALKSVLDSKSTEDSLAILARWEPGHGCFGFPYPWKQYLNIGEEIRHCACFMEALAVQISKKNLEFSNLKAKRRILDRCMDMSIESGKVLLELVSGIRTMTVPFAAKQHMAMAIVAMDNLKASLSEDTVFLELLQPSVIAFILIEIVQCVHQIKVSVEKLAELACFKTSQPVCRATIEAFTAIEVED